MRYEIERTEYFDLWLKKLRDRQAVLAINKRLTRVTLGNFGDYKEVGADIFELRFFIGPGYRVYFTIRDETIVLLLCGGDKSSQEVDIKRAVNMARNMEN